MPTTEVSSQCRERNVGAVDRLQSSKAQEGATRDSFSYRFQTSKLPLSRDWHRDRRRPSHTACGRHRATGWVTLPGGKRKDLGSREGSGRKAPSEAPELCVSLTRYAKHHQLQIDTLALTLTGDEGTRLSVSAQRVPGDSLHPDSQAQRTSVSSRLGLA